MKHKDHQALVVEIARHNDWKTYIILLVGFTACFTYFFYGFVSPFFRMPFSTDSLYSLPFIAFIVAWYGIVIRLGAWRAFGVERIVIKDGMFCWTRTALRWIRKLEIPTKDITAIDAVTPWHALRNRVEFTALGKRRIIGDMLLVDETTELAESLRHALGLSKQL